MAPPSSEMSQDSSSVIIDKIDQLQKSLDRLDSEMEHDREGSQNLQIRMGAVEDQLAQLRSGQATMVKKIKNKVDDAIEPLSDNIAKKRAFIIKSDSWFKKLFKK